jgi:hypothetical protein
VVRWSTIWLGVTVTTVLMAATASDASAASTVKVSGSLTHASLPPPAAGVSLVQALDLSDGTLAATDYADRRGRYSIKVPPGPYALVGGSVFSKSTKPTVRLLGALRARAGKPRHLALSLRPKRRRPGRAAANGSAAPPIVGVPYFTGGAPFQSRGLATMVETDLVQLNAGPPCKFTVVDVQRRDEVIREIRLQQTEFFDPATRVRPGRLLQPQLLVKGRLTPQAGGGLSYDISVVDAGSGKVKGSTSGQIPESAFTTASQGIARELAKIAQSQGCSNELHQASGSYGQVLFEREGSTVKATAYTFPWEAPATGCSGKNLSEQVVGEGTFPLSMVGAETITVALSRHEDTSSRVYEGSGTLTLQRVG